METQHSAAFLKQRKFLMALPLLILPFFTMTFWALGGGKGLDQNVQPVNKGLNLLLPDADFKNEKPQNKMSLYDMAGKDSAKLQSGFNDTARINSNLVAPKSDPHEIAIQEKLAQLKTEMNREPAQLPYGNQKPGNQPDPGMSKDVAKLEAMMKTMQASGGSDPEMAQLNSMMDKIMAIQNPGLVKQQNQKIPDVKDTLFKAIPAVIDGNQKVVEGSVVTLRLLDTITINGQIIPKGHQIFGLAEISNQRLNLEIKNIRIGTAIVPVNLTVFDQRDAMVGINAPEAIISGAVSGGADNALQSMQFLSMDQSLATQAAGAGISAAKGLFSKKVKTIKVKLKDKYPLLLRDNTRKTNSFTH